MAKYVVAGKSDCPFFAQAELIADELKMRLPEFSVHKIVLKPEEWSEWISKTCEEKGWIYNGDSPIIWRELINRGGKGMLLGGCNEFFETVKGYYGISCSKLTSHLKEVANENKLTKDKLVSLEKQKAASSNLCNVTVINCNSDKAYNILPHLCKNDLFDCEISLTLHYCDNKEVDNIDKKFEDSLIYALAMELEDCAFDQLKEILVTTDIRNSIKGADYLIILSEASMEKTNLIHLKNCGLCINDELKQSSKVLICGDNALKSLYIVSQFAPNVPSENMFGLSRLPENRLKCAIAKKLNVTTAKISNVVVWGATDNFIIDLTKALVQGFDGAIWATHLENYSHTVKEMLYDKSWITDELPQVLLLDGRRNFISTSSALISQLSDIKNPHRKGIFSLGCISQGWYDVPVGIPFSFPVIYENGCVEISDNLELSEEFRENIKLTAESFADECQKMLKEVE